MLSSQLRRSVVAALLAVAAASAAPGLAQPAELGAVDFPNSGSDRAQAPFLHGVAALHSFWYPEAADAFRRAQQIDPGFALAYWGEALTHDHPLWNQQDLDAARDTLAKLGPDAAARAARAATARERGYLETVEILFFGDGDRVARHSDYAESLERLSERFPDDENAAALHALALQAVAHHGGGDKARMRSAAILEELFDAHPAHPGVLHYLIHAYDDPVHAPLGLRPARIYADVAPAAPHALHMPSHIFLQLGMWQEVADSNEDAYRASVGWVRRKGLSRDEEDLHSLSWLHYALLQTGQTEEAARALETAAGVARATGSTRARRTHEAMLGRHLLEAESEAPGARVAGHEPATASADLALALGLSAAAAGELDRAEAALARLRELAAPSSGEETGYDSGTDGRIRALEVEGALAIARGRVDEGLAALAEAAELERASDPPSGPPYPLKPALELHAEALLAAGRPAEAAAELRAAMARTPNRKQLVRGLAAALQAPADGPDRLTHNPGAP